MTLAVGQDAKKVAERLKATETDVLYAWGYWKGKGYLQEEKKQETERPALVSSVRPDYSPRELALYIKMIRSENYLIPRRKAGENAFAAGYEPAV